MAAIKNLKLYKKIEILHENNAGATFSYTCYEAIPNGGFCVISASPANSGTLNEEASFVKLSDQEFQLSSNTFHATLIDAIKAFSPRISAS